MRYFLVKTEPQIYSIHDLERDGQTTWDGVRNPQAVRFLKEMKPGDQVLMYHSQGESAIVGLAEVVGESRPDPNDAQSWLIDLKHVKTFRPPYVTLKLIKDTGFFGDFRLVYQSRLSTMEVPDTFITWLKERGVELD
jgi:predicted RNA-binding protein with PUA-like domain